MTRVLTPLAAGNFWYEYTFPKGVAVNEDRLEIDVPKAREVKLKAPVRKPEIQDTGDRRVYTWVVKDIKPERDKDKDKDEDEATGPDVQLTTFTDWKQVAAWYAKLQGERMTVDDSVRKKADELTKGAATPSEKAQRLYDFVARNVRYVSISLGIGRYQPHAASDVLRNGYGDCKDKHTLFSALLRAEGIQSYPVLIDSSRKLDVDVPSPAQFDHVITAARLGTGTELTWLDTTPEVTPFGLILYQLRNKQAVLASEDSEGGLQRTPADSPIKTFMRFTLDGKFSDFGALDATLEVTAQGDRDWPMRSSFRRFSQAQWKDFVKALSASWGLPGDVDDVQVDPIEDTSKPFHLKYRLHRGPIFCSAVGEREFSSDPAAGAARGSSVGEKHGAVGHWPRGRNGLPRAIAVSLQLHSAYADAGENVARLWRLFIGVFAEQGNSGRRAQTGGEGERGGGGAASGLRIVSQCSAQRSRPAVVVHDLTPSGQGAQTAAKMEGTPAELHKAGVKALQSKDYRTAIDLLKRAVDADSSLANSGHERRLV